MTGSPGCTVENGQNTVNQLYNGKKKSLYKKLVMIILHNDNMLKGYYLGYTELNTLLKLISLAF